MSIQNLAIVFGQTLFGQVGPGNGSIAGHGNGVMADAPFQNKVTIRPYLSVSTHMLIFATFTGDRDDIRTLL